MDLAEIERLHAETKALREAITNITLTWSVVESAMALVLARTIHDQPGAFAFPIYFAPNNTETRFRIVDAAFLTLASASPHEAIILCHWRQLLVLLNRVKGVRNQISHGAITTIGVNNKNHVRLTAAMFDVDRIVPALRRRQLPGMSSNDIEQSIQKMGALRDIIDRFSAVAQAIHQADEPTLLQKLAEIGEHLKTEYPPKDGQS